MIDRARQTDDRVFLKHYPSRRVADTAWHRSAVAQQHGVPTPPVQERSGPMTLGFQRVTAEGQPTLAEMIDVLARLHRIPPQGLDRFDPFLRIRPRLAQAPPEVVAMAERLAAQDAALVWRETAVIHGDFHPGQLLRDRKGKVWLVDLDDLALAPPEADLGNLAAWQATQLPVVGLAEKVAAVQALILAAAPWAVPALIGHFCQIALLRRALKLAGRGQPWVLEHLALRA